MDMDTDCFDNLWNWGNDVLDAIINWGMLCCVLGNVYNIGDIAASVI